MLPKDSAIVNEIKKYLIYYATQLEDEGQRLKDSIDKNNFNMFNRLKENSLNILSDINKFWELMDSKNN